MKVYHGNILTVDKNDTVAEYLVENCGRIVYVGDSLPEAFKDAKTIELREKALVPSLSILIYILRALPLFMPVLTLWRQKATRKYLKCCSLTSEKARKK